MTRGGYGAGCCVKTSDLGMNVGGRGWDEDIETAIGTEIETGIEIVALMER